MQYLIAMASSVSPSLSPPHNSSAYSESPLSFRAALFKGRIRFCSSQPRKIFFLSQRRVFFGQKNRKFLNTWVEDHSPLQFLSFPLQSWAGFLSNSPTCFVVRYSRMEKDVDLVNPVWSTDLHHRVCLRVDVEETPHFHYYAKLSLCAHVHIKLRINMLAMLQHYMFFFQSTICCRDNEMAQCVIVTVTKAADLTLNPGNHMVKGGNWLLQVLHMRSVACLWTSHAHTCTHVCTHTHINVL